MAFSKLQLSDPILKALDDEGYHTPTPIQAKAIPPILEGRDLLGCAQTGTGKTAAFALPIIHRLHSMPADKTRRGAHPPRALILSPTRELVAQIGESFQTYGRHSGLTGTTIYGGVSQFHQVRALQRGVDILVATPGRLIDLMEQGHVDLSHISVFVLDEADRMLDMGFIQPIRRIAGSVPKQRQTLLFSATMPKEIMHLAEALLKNPVKVAVTPVASAAPLIEQHLYMVPLKLKQSLLHRLLEDPKVTRAVVFTKTKHGADRVCRKLHHAGVSAVAIHGNKAQNYRLRALESLKSGKSRVLVATDVAARGLDVDSVSHVFNFDLPMEPEAYVHRIGRTGRAGATGIAISFCDSQEHDLLRSIQRLTGKSIPQTELPKGLEPIASPSHHADEYAPYPEPKSHSGAHHRPRHTHGQGPGHASGHDRAHGSSSREHFAPRPAPTQSRGHSRPIERAAPQDEAPARSSDYRQPSPANAKPHSPGAPGKRPHRKGPPRDQSTGSHRGSAAQPTDHRTARPQPRSRDERSGSPSSPGPRAHARPHPKHGHPGSHHPGQNKSAGPRRGHR